ncbi:putative nucleotide-binding alpha-beta plait domain superfamily, RNA-binding domain superfamily [Helianthus annuus]|uniref:Nucleotide-binding alpha-beta plait domain superfamily, RNA-binding domain superfamily n=1 Tax=Helianthus annuus TaxID=4232 RepID=A0A9K3NJ75_HELAN|nr:putative nucleotide-binding alpha-beta plait domain superfamily, RNA-binding domain superfamily [Helianthus annuus]KAJ0559827.1 putative nucleotide-binding alpha-beta plait domain superfamily, RNA-binding domain superfamily [Helianthus annuus]KAJ0565938.1 putative nucleotide-binding alpha-beta plait domain superfamily, RNA-binding domain superfamily [Helianthus annuus]KAJ0572807.1 putative nucleotide-binding alpha-beta plait domain superfamily, RNA-binding domain superfamily [Helianthus annuu
MSPTYRIGVVVAILATVLRGHGDIYDIYIAKKRDKGGNRFGFVSFLDVKDKEEMVRNMQNLRLGEYKLSINVARFVFEEGEIRDPPPRPKPVKESVLKQSHTSNGGRQVRYEKTSTFSSKEALTGVRSNVADSSKVLRLGEKTLVFNELCGRTILVRVGDFVLVSRFQRKLLDMGLGEGVIRYLGGMQFLVTFKTPEHAIMAKDELLGRSDEFVNVSIWDGQEVEFERVAWVKILGLPIQLCDPEIFEEVASVFGKVVQKVNFDPSSFDMSGGCVGILVNSGIIINGEVSVLWSDKLLSVWFMEVSGDKQPVLFNSKPFGGSVVETSDDDSSSDEDMSDEAYAGDDEAKVDGTPEVTGVLNGINGDCEIQGNSNHVADSSLSLRTIIWKVLFLLL